MTLPEKLLVSLRLRADTSFEFPRLLPKVVATFHQWIASHALGEILIDVADYSHVPDGPVVLIGNDHNYSLAPRDGELELACFRKRPTPAQNPLLHTLRRLLGASALLQEALRECAVVPSTPAIQVSVFDRKVTDLHPFRPTEFAWLVAEHLATASGVRPNVSVASGTVRPTVHAAWTVPTALEQLREHDFDPTRAGGLSDARAQDSRSSP